MIPSKPTNDKSDTKKMRGLKSIAENQISQNNLIKIIQSLPAVHLGKLNSQSNTPRALTNQKTTLKKIIFRVV